MDRANIDVVYLTKVRIFKQITTEERQTNQTHTMLFTLQRYEFLSKSQLVGEYGPSKYRCCLPYKGTNF